jgi:hypothetical protein
MNHHGSTTLRFPTEETCNFFLFISRVLKLKETANWPSVIADNSVFSCRYLCSLPLVLVVGVATTLAAFHRLLPQSITAKLTINT